MIPTNYLEDLSVQLLNFFKAESVGIIISIALIFLIGKLFSIGATKYLHDNKKKIRSVKWIRYITSFFSVAWVLLLYNSHMQKETPFSFFLIGLFLAGVAFSMRDLFSNIIGWIVIVSRKGFNNGDRITIGEISGDVIDIGILRTIVAEIGNWVEADQSTGRLISIPNSKILTHEIINFTQGFGLIWNESKVLITFESDWKRAEKILEEIGEKDFQEKQEQIAKSVKNLKRDFMLQYNYLTPKVYIKIKESGVELTLRYMVRVRRRRTLEDLIAREILTAFAKEKNVNLAYPTIRIFNPEK